MKKNQNFKAIQGSACFFMLVMLLGCQNSKTIAIKKIEITGNWHQESGFLPHIQTREPALKEGECSLFSQELILSPGNYYLQFEYDQKQEEHRGRAIDQQYKGFEGLQVNGEIIALKFTCLPDDSTLWNAAYAFTVQTEKENTTLELAIGNTRVFRTWLSGDKPFRNSNKYRGIAPEGTKEGLLVRNIPFLVRKVDLHHYAGLPRKRFKEDRGSLQSWNDGMCLPLRNTHVDKAHFLGMIHKADISNGSWYSDKGDDGYSHFVGDTAGVISINWTEGGNTEIPLVFGFNLWFGRPWDILWYYVPGRYGSWPYGINCDSTLFSGEDGHRDILSDGIQLVDGTRPMGAMSNNTRFIFSIDLEGRAVKSIEVKGVKDMHEYPLISGLTIETADDNSPLPSLPHLSDRTPVTKTVTLDEIERGEYRPRIEKIMRTIYSFKDALPKLKEPEIPEGYFGPQFNFKGNQEAIYAATYMYKNGPEVAAHIGDAGTSCSSSTAQKATIHYTLGLGIWRKLNPIFGSYSNWLRIYQEKEPGELGQKAMNDKGQLVNSGTAWSRGIGELMRETMALGHDKFINTYTDWLDERLFEDATPPHWVRTPGSNRTNYERQVGDILETGNRENDGHGICMWGRYMTWYWQGKPKAWNEKHWKATSASVDWIKWQLDTDTIFPGVRKDVLYTESECSHNDYEFYSSYNCLHGLKLAIIMAKELEKEKEADEWTILYHRLRQGILDNLIDESEFGPVWHTEPENNWYDDAHKMVHLHLATEGFTYTPLQDYAKEDTIEQKYLDIDKNCYRLLMKDKNYNCLRMYGYGQGMMTQAALLLDEMEDAEQFINMMVNHAYQPQLEGWTAPEGVILHKSGKYWVPVNGYMGQDSHLADSYKALRLMLGIDDNNPDHLRLVPRFPNSWDEASIKEYPVLTGNKRQKIRYTYKRGEDGQTFEYTLGRPVQSMSVRLGPVPEGKIVTGVLVDGEKAVFTNLRSGDSEWVWVEDLSGPDHKIEMKF